jgi:hypothetical protein
MRLFRRRRQLDERVADARARREAAGQQAKLSQDRQDAVRDRVVVPLRQAAEANQFAAMIEASLQQGWRRTR